MKRESELHTADSFESVVLKAFEIIADKSNGYVMKKAQLTGFKSQMIVFETKTNIFVRNDFAPIVTMKILDEGKKVKINFLFETKKRLIGMYIYFACFYVFFTSCFMLMEEGDFFILCFMMMIMLVHWCLMRIMIFSGFSPSSKRIFETWSEKLMK